jgi:D-sedoheptulose 7-phosphate isomerase
MAGEFLAETAEILCRIDRLQVHGVTEELRNLRERSGRLFVIGNGGGAGHASHAAADFRKIGGIEAYAWGDNISDVTAYINDVSWETCIARWLEDSKFTANDCLMVFSVGGSSDKVSANLKWAMSYAYTAPIIGFVGADGGELARYGTAVVVIPSTFTPQVEGIQAVLWHAIVTAL